MKKLLKTVFSIFGFKIQKIRTVEGASNYNLSDLFPFLDIDDDAVIIDGGANEGQTVNFLLKHSKKFKIFCFEPDPKLFFILNKKFSNSENIKIFDQALSNVKKVHEFNIYKTTKLSSIKQLNPSPNQRSPLVKTITVNGTTLDKFVNDIGIDKIDLLKLDLQGFE
jgi:FkbM family methyltransferase